MKGPVLVINPNSDIRVTAEIDRAIDFARGCIGHAFECLTIDSSPLTISTDKDVELAGEKVINIVSDRSDAAAVIIACFSDPGLEQARAICKAPVIGIQQAAVLTAIATTGNFGVIALSPKSINRHIAIYRQLGLDGCFAGEIGLSNVSALDAGKSEDAFRESIEVGNQLIQQGATSIVLGCAGFSPRRAALEYELGVPVIDPIRAAAAMILGQLS